MLTELKGMQMTIRAVIKSISLLQRNGKTARPMSGIYAWMLAASLSAFSTLIHADYGKTILVLDASGSMWQKIDDGYKIRIAQDVINGLLKTLPADQELGLMTYGAGMLVGNYALGYWGDRLELDPSTQAGWLEDGQAFWLLPSIFAAVIGVIFLLTFWDKSSAAAATDPKAAPGKG